MPYFTSKVGIALWQIISQNIGAKKEIFLKKTADCKFLILNALLIDKNS